MRCPTNQRKSPRKIRTDRRARRRCQWCPTSRRPDCTSTLCPCTLGLTLDVRQPQPEDDAPDKLRNTATFFSKQYTIRAACQQPLKPRAGLAGTNVGLDRELYAFRTFCLTVDAVLCRVRLRTLILLLRNGCPQALHSCMQKYTFSNEEVRWGQLPVPIDCHTVRRRRADSTAANPTAAVET
ncbi:hypothetical protein C8Q72DRAFT_287327 [Fomitopsis betulina]|nr:hypothetical protein C8Q72DRAFT_287327 [Fomitopsis betulina]